MFHLKHNAATVFLKLFLRKKNGRENKFIKRAFKKQFSVEIILSKFISGLSIYNLNLINFSKLIGKSDFPIYRGNELLINYLLSDNANPHDENFISLNKQQTLSKYG